MAALDVINNHCGGGGGDSADARIARLEKKVTHHEDEIICLKSALCDALKRITALEQSSPPTLLPSRGTALRASHQGPAAKAATSASAAQQPSSPSVTQLGPVKRAGSGQLTVAVRNDSVPTTPTRSLPPSPSPTTRRAPSVKWQSGEHLPTKELVQFHLAEGLVRMFLRGRPVIFPIPTSYTPSTEDNSSTAAALLPAQPSAELKLEWVYGYRGRDCRSNLFLLPSGELVYFVAAIAVLYNVEEGSQRHYLGHTDDIKCMAIHPDKITVATGQVTGAERKASKAHVRIWDSVTLATLKVVGVGCFERAVACVAFSVMNSGVYLCAVDDATDHNLSVWEWQKGDKGIRLAETKSSGDAVLAAEFHPYEKDRIVLCGKSMVAFWDYEGGTLRKQLGLFEKYDKPKYVICLAFNSHGDVVTGDSNGNIFFWGSGGNRITDSILLAHDGPVFALCYMKDGSLVSGGGRDRLVKQWSLELKTAIGLEVDESLGAVRTLAPGYGNMILVGTTQNSILQGSMELGVSLITRGHFDEVWGLGTHPNQNQFLTCGNDKCIFLWDSLSHSAVWSKEIKDGAHCASFHPSGSVVAIGTLSARWLILDALTRDVVCSHTDGEEPLQGLEYSPDGSYLAVASRDNNIYVYEVTSEGRKYTRVGKCHGHTSFVTHIDWSADSTMIMSNSGDYEALYWSIPLCKQILHAEKVKDSTWATQNCTLSFNTLGMWQEGADGTDINACCRNHQSSLLVSSDDFGRVNLFKYPSTTAKASCRTYTGHSSHVTNARFLHDDSRLLSTGGKDTAILQWRVVT